MKKIFIALALLLALQAASPAVASGQDVVVIEPLFEYPVAPDNLESLADKSNYLAQHFWDALDTKSKGVPQVALNDAFGVYTAALQFAEREVALKSIDELLKRIRKNPTMLLQMAKAAEDNLYGPKARIVSDEAYLPFVRAVATNKKVPELRRARWKRQLEILERSLTGTVIPAFAIEERKGGKGTFQPRAKYTIIEFGDPGCDDCRFSRLTLDTNVELTKLVDSEQVEVVFAIISPEEGWQQEVDTYPAKWLVCSAEGVDDVIDIRNTPTFYVVDSEGRIIDKNIPAANAAALVISLLDGSRTSSEK